MLHFVGVDQSLNEPGLVVLSEDGALVVAAALKVVARCRGAQRLHTLASWYDAHLPNVSYGGAAMEGPSLGSEHREFDLGEASGIAKHRLYVGTGVDPLIVAPLQLKKYIAGTTGARKEDVMNAVKSRYGFSTDNDNIADAYVLAQVARHLTLDIRPPTRAAAEVIAALRFEPPASAPAARGRKTRSKSSLNV